MFLDKNELILCDYIPGSSGRLLLRLISEMDAKIDYVNPVVMAQGSISENPASKEIDFHTLPKRYIEWFWHKKPKYDINTVFDQIGCLSIALRERSNFFPNMHYDMSGERIYYGCHSWTENIDYTTLDKNIKPVSIVPTTDIGVHYQQHRCELCWPTFFTQEWANGMQVFNNKSHATTFDFCTALVTRNTEMTVEFIKQFLGEYREEKVDRVCNLLDIYYDEVVGHV